MIYIQFILDVFPFCCVSTWSRIRLDIKISRVSFGGKIVRACRNTPCAAVHQIHHSLGIASQELWHAVCCNKRGRQCKFWSKNKVTRHQNIRKKSPGQEDTCGQGELLSYGSDVLLKSLHLPYVSIHLLNLGCGSCQSTPVSISCE